MLPNLASTNKQPCVLSNLSTRDKLKMLEKREINRKLNDGVRQKKKT